MGWRTRFCTPKEAGSMFSTRIMYFAYLDYGTLWGAGLIRRYIYIYIYINCSSINYYEPLRGSSTFRVLVRRNVYWYAGTWSFAGKGAAACTGAWAFDGVVATIGTGAAVGTGVAAGTGTSACFSCLFMVSNFFLPALKIKNQIKINIQPVNLVNFVEKTLNFWFLLTFSLSWWVLSCFLCGVVFIQVPKSTNWEWSLQLLSSCFPSTKINELGVKLVAAA